MIVTDTTLVGFTMITGTWGLQLGLLIATLFNYFIYPVVIVPQNVHLTYDEW